MSCNYDNKMNQICQVAELLHHGANNPTSRTDLIAITGLDARTITKCIEAERRSGKAILANNKGYYLPSSPGDIDDYLARLGHREAEIRLTRAAISQTRQTRMEFGGGDQA